LPSKVHTSRKGSILRRISRNFLAFVNVVLVLIFILACVQPWLPPEQFWFIGYLSISFPYLLLVLFIFMISWLFSSRHRKYFLISLIGLALGYKQIGVLFSLQANGFSQAKQSGDIRIMTWNVMSFYGFKAGDKEREKNADRIFDLMRELKPDIICLQEYGQFEDPKLGRSYLEQMEGLGYKHNVLSRDYSRVNYSYSSGLAIFSRHPILSKERIPYRSSAESLLFADIAVGKDTVRIFTTHLQSYRFSTDELEEIERIKETEKPRWMASKSLLSKMQRAFRNRGAQVNQAIPLIDSSAYPAIIGLDMNDVPNSYAYWNIRGKRKDAFLEKGFGIGRTYMSLLPTLRIDYIFADPRFSVTQMVKLNKPYSDHLPVIADLRLEK
jgi:endonuclease/exonuclease/phosphatase family metal-dependent hydrolase